MIVLISRLILVTCGLMGGWLTTRIVDWQAELGLSPSYVIFLLVILGGSIGYVLGGIIGRELSVVWRRMLSRLAELSAADFVLFGLGLVFGLIVAFLATQPLRLLEPAPLALGLTILIYVMTVYAGVSIALTRHAAMVAMFPRLEAATDIARREHIVLLDTSAVIDGRFVDIARLGFFPGSLRVPRFVLSELQTLADSADDTKRARGRRGLDLLATLPDAEMVATVERDYPDIAGVDEKLVRLALDSDAHVVTLDYNLSRVASVRGVRVLNLNEIASALRPSFLPGDLVRIHVSRAGKEAGQGVGHLEDGTMVVVADGREFIGQDADVEVTSVLQTPAGRMIFSRPANGE